MNRERLLERFLRYVAIDTTADDTAKTYPSSPGQLELGRMLADELSDLGLADVRHDEYGLVMATLPPTVIGTDVPVVAFNAHLDTSPETSGANVRPQVIRNYAGGDIVLPGDPSQVIRVADNPELEQLRRHHADHHPTAPPSWAPTTRRASPSSWRLAAYLIEHPEVPHGPVRILFTCDEEIGHGVDHVDLQQLAAHVCYTLDGAGPTRLTWRRSRPIWPR